VNDARSWPSRRSRRTLTNLPSRPGPRAAVGPAGPSRAVLDQGKLGSCTDNATTQLINIDYFAKSRRPGHYLTETDAVAIYELATHLDGIAGNTYPPNDDDSSGLGAAKAGVKLKYQMQNLRTNLRIAQSVCCNGFSTKWKWGDRQTKRERQYADRIVDAAGRHQGPEIPYDDAVLMPDTDPA
jgi:hypothetical protein